jgi:predicted amidohydrolase YtcJ
MKAIIASLLMTFAMLTSAKDPSVAPDQVILDAKVHTMDPAKPLAAAVAISGKVISAIGSSAEIRALAGPETRIINAGNKLLLPGFNDAHVHWLMGGFSITNVNLRDARSTAEFAARLEAYAKKVPKGQWIQGGDWDHEKWPGTPLPTREMIDAITLDHPVFVNRTDGHMALANSLALKLAGITRETREVPGGLIVRDGKTGEPTGILKDAAMDLVDKVIPQRSCEEKRAAARAATAPAG